MAVQLALEWEMPPPSRPPAWRVQQDEWIRRGILRHHTVGYAHDEYHHSARPIRLEWDTAGGNKAGDLIPAVLCCLCGWPATNESLLDLGHGCASGAFSHSAPRMGLQFYLDGDWPTPRPAPGRSFWYPMLAERLPAVDDQDDTDDPEDDSSEVVSA